jgi:hypothetical protein
MAAAEATVQPANNLSIGHFDILSGHLGHLSESQQQALATFKDNLFKVKLYTPASDTEGKKASHDEPTLLFVSSTLTLQEA